jgi:hypothetical protein
LGVCDFGASCHDVFGSRSELRSQLKEKQRVFIQMDLIVLVCVISAALAAGVLAAYGLCLAMFKAFHMHALQVAQKKAAAPAVATAPSIVQG